MIRASRDLRRRDRRPSPLPPRRGGATGAPAATGAARHAGLALLLALLVGLPGCTYFRHLGKDAGETLHVSVGASLVPGLYARVQAPLFSTSFGWLRRGGYVGTDYGHAFAWKQASAGIVLGGELVRTDLDADIDRFWTGHLADAYLDTSHYFVLTLVATDTRTALGSRTLSLTKFEVGVHALVVGAQVGLDALELLDLVTGVFGWDLLDDDEFGSADAAPPEAPRAAEPVKEKPPKRPRKPDAPAPDPLDDDDLEDLGSR